MTKSIGITGTRTGATPEQFGSFATLVGELHAEGYTDLHHGDCVGVDEQAHNLALFLGLNIVIHPPIKRDFRAFCQGEPGFPPVETLEPDSYFSRSRQIVQDSDILLALPDSPVERPRSGTWYTINYALAMGRHTIIIQPDGLLVGHNLPQA